MTDPDDDLEPVPTLPELAARGPEYAWQHPGSRYTPTPKGDALIVGAMRRNGERNRTR